MDIRKQGMAMNTIPLFIESIKSKSMMTTICSDFESNGHGFIDPSMVGCAQSFLGAQKIIIPVLLLHPLNILPTPFQKLSLRFLTNEEHNEPLQNCFRIKRRKNVFDAVNVCSAMFLVATILPPLPRIFSVVWIRTEP